MPAQPNETPQESIRTVMQLLMGASYRSTREGDISWWELTGADMLAIQARLEDALAKLETR